MRRKIMYTECPCPEYDSGVNVDANVFIAYAIFLKIPIDKEKKRHFTVELYETNGCRDFFDFCRKSGVIIYYIKKIQAECYKNLTRVIRKTFKMFPYAIQKEINENAKFNLGMCFAEFSCTSEKYLLQELVEAKELYRSHPKQRTSYKPKPLIPSDNDLILLISASKLPHEKRYLLSDDSDFTDFEDEIHSEYAVFVLPFDLLNRLMIDEWHVKS